MSSTSISICWLRRDLRLHDQAALFHALGSGNPVLPIFIFDRDILDKLENKQDRRVVFIHQTLESIQRQLAEMGSTLAVYYGKPLEVFRKVVQQYTVSAVYTNHDYEPYAQKRDGLIKDYLGQSGIAFHTFKDQVIFEKGEVVKDDAKPYTVFTPYSRKWKARLLTDPIRPFDNASRFSAFVKMQALPMPSLDEMGFAEVPGDFPERRVEDDIIRHYQAQRDFPAIRGTSRLGVHLRFGTIGIRTLANHVREMSETYLNELIWREFYQMILWHFPQVGAGASFKPAYEQINWRNNEAEFAAWCAGQTGYPIVDAGMRELNSTGYMHNRVRMIVASFLSKHLLIDWRWGEAYFAEKLLDFDLAANNGGWQWASGSGCDAAPYFRVFNPTLQTQKFDPELRYVRQWVPEFQEFNYPRPIVVHEMARKRCLEVYAAALKG